MTKVKTLHVSKKYLFFLKLIRKCPSSSICLSGAGLCDTRARGPRGEDAVTEAVAVASRRLLNTAELWRESGGWKGDMARYQPRWILGARPGGGQLYTDNRMRLRGNLTISSVIRVVYLTDYMVV